MEIQHFCNHGNKNVDVFDPNWLFIGSSLESCHNKEVVISDANRFLPKGTPYRLINKPKGDYGRTSGFVWMYSPDMNTDKWSGLVSKGQE